MSRWVWLPALLLAFMAPALAQQQQPKCQEELEQVQRMIAETRLPQAKETQIRSILEQAARACRENDEVVAMAGIDQVKAILKEQQKAG